jgi:hypothetical protein
LTLLLGYGRKVPEPGIRPRDPWQDVSYTRLLPWSLI